MSALLPGCDDLDYEAELTGVVAEVRGVEVPFRLLVEDALIVSRSDDPAGPSERRLDEVLVVADERTDLRAEQPDGAMVGASALDFTVGASIRACMFGPMIHTGPPKGYATRIELLRPPSSQRSRAEGGRV
jgi:hypothetical protein